MSNDIKDIIELLTSGKALLAYFLLYLILGMSYGLFSRKSNEEKNHNKPIQTPIRTVSEVKPIIKYETAEIKVFSESKNEGIYAYYVYARKETSDKKYKLPAEIMVTKITIFNHTTHHKNEIKNKLTSYELHRVYWTNGGYISFVPDNPTTEYTLQQLEIGEESRAVSVKGDVYYITLTTEPVDMDFRQLDEIKKEEKFLKNLKDAVYKNIEYLLADTVNKHDYFSELIADYRQYLNLQISENLKSKDRPALKASEEVKELSKKYRNLEKDFHMLKYQLDMYEKVFPWITEFKEFSLKEINEIRNEKQEIKTERQYLSSYLSPDEYNKLSRLEKYQLALDRYRKKEKSNWQIGIEFERYIGYLYETKGYKVTYYGAKKGLEDLGRDLIVSKDNDIIVIQCKNWSKDKTIHEKHIFQLFGTMFALNVEKTKNNNKISFENEIIEFTNIYGEFITTTSLSNAAKLYADRLNIRVKEHVDFDKNYPCIKCNIGKDGEKIYHLPFDQQYDNIVIDASKGECYANTIREAEDLGFRHAFRWRNND